MVKLHVIDVNANNPLYGTMLLWAAGNNTDIVMLSLKNETLDVNVKSHY